MASAWPGRWPRPARRLVPRSSTRRGTRPPRQRGARRLRPWRDALLGGDTDRLHLGGGRVGQHVDPLLQLGAQGGDPARAGRRYWPWPSGSRISPADQGDLRVAAEPRVFVEPAGAGLMPAGPPVPVRDVTCGHDGTVSAASSRLTCGTVSGTRPGSAGGGWSAATGGGACVSVRSRSSAAVTAQIARPRRPARCAGRSRGRGGPGTGPGRSSLSKTRIPLPLASGGPRP